jgi:hypothetical protein
MSRICGIKLEVIAPNHDQIDLLNLLLEAGWRPGFQGNISFLPVGDNQDYDWQSKPSTEWQDVYSILVEKVRGGEQIGIDLTWEETNIGGTFHFELDEDRKIIWTVWYANRPLLANCEWLTDHSWFKERIVPTFLKAGIEIAYAEDTDIY